MQAKASPNDIDFGSSSSDGESFLKIIQREEDIMMMDSPQMLPSNGRDRHFNIKREKNLSNQVFKQGKGRQEHHKLEKAAKERRNTNGEARQMKSRKDYEDVA